VGKNKLAHFEENKSFPNFFQPLFNELENGFVYQGKWCDTFFKNSKPLVLELGCGKGDYTVGLSVKYPNVNFMGVDRKGARMWRGAKTSQEENIQNVAFLRIKIEQLLYCFGNDEVDGIWITFPDPIPKERKSKRRLTSPQFLKKYRTILKPGGIIHLKTDNSDLFQYTIEVLKDQPVDILYQTFDLYNSDYDGDAPLIQTYYEKKYLVEGKPINYLKFRFNE